MEHFVTLFDSLFLPQGLALHMSMERHIKKYVLWILCVDDQVYRDLGNLNLPNVRLLQLSRLETDELLQIKPTRSKGEYCWTLTPFAPRFVFEADINVVKVTYIDADIWFMKNPKVIYDQFEKSGKSVMITGHGYGVEYDVSSTSGQYCVQFIIFIRDKSEPIRKWWEERCIEWCYSYLEGDRYGDQRYLDDWTERFAKEVHVYEKEEHFLAPWNADRFPYGTGIIFHFHELRLINPKKIILVKGYYLPKVMLENVYQPYINDFELALSRMKCNDIEIRMQALSSNFIVNILKSIKKFLTKINLLELNKIKKINY
jgi:hypothetical protein